MINVEENCSSAERYEFTAARSSIHLGAPRLYKISAGIAVFDCQRCCGRQETRQSPSFTTKNCQRHSAGCTSAKTAA